jgi:hypothetical protein
MIQKSIRRTNQSNHQLPILKRKVDEDFGAITKQTSSAFVKTAFPY